MNENIQSLSDIAVGEKARVTALNTDSSITRRLLDIGLIENTEVECIGRSPLGDPSAFLIRGAVIALRYDDSRKILVSQSGNM
jgi:ferrous iron transport protein A